jgi:hypothetical protein
MSSRLRLEPEEETHSTPTIAGPAAATGSPRYDADAQQKIVALASRLQQEHDQTLTVEQIAAAGAEVGLAPAFVQEAVSRLEAAEAEATVRAATRPRRPRPVQAVAGIGEQIGERTGAAARQQTSSGGAFGCPSSTCALA